MLKISTKDIGKNCNIQWQRVHKTDMPLTFPSGRRTIYIYIIVGVDERNQMAVITSEYLKWNTSLEVRAKDLMLERYDTWNS